MLTGLNTLTPRKNTVSPGNELNNVPSSLHLMSFLALLASWLVSFGYSRKVPELCRALMLGIHKKFIFVLC